MTTLPEEAVTSAAIIQVITDLRLAILQDDDEGLAEHAEPMVKAKELIAKLSALPFLPVQGAVRAKELPWKDTGDSDQGRNSYAQTRIGRYEAFEMRLLKETIYGWSRGHGDEKADSFEAAKAAAQADFEARILSALEPSATRELALEEILREVDEIERKVWAWSGSAFLNNELEGAEDADCKTELYSELCRIGNAMHWLRTKICALSSPDHADAVHAQARDVLARFRDYVIEGITAGTIMRGGEHHNPIWQEVASVLHADAGKVEGDGEKWPMRELIAKAMAYQSVGDPHAKTVHGNQRWEWFVEDADKFINAFGYYLPALPSAPASEGAE